MCVCVWGGGGGGKGWGRNARMAYQGLSSSRGKKRDPENEVDYLAAASHRNHVARYPSSRLAYHAGVKWVALTFLS